MIIINDFFFNYIDLAKTFDKAVESSVIICPFTKFKVTEIKFENDREIVKLTEIKEFALNEKFFTYMFNVDVKNISNNYNRQQKFFEKSLQLTENLHGESSPEFTSELNKMGDFFYAY